MQNIHETKARHLLLLIAHATSRQDRPAHVRVTAKPGMHTIAQRVTPLASAWAKACYSNTTGQCCTSSQLLQSHAQRLNSPTTAARKIGCGWALRCLQVVRRPFLRCTHTAGKDFCAHHQHQAAGSAIIGDTGNISSYYCPWRRINCLDEFFCAHNTCMPGELMPNAEDGAQSDPGRPRSDTFPDTNVNNHHDTRFPCHRRKNSNTLRAPDMCRLFKMTGDHV